MYKFYIILFSIIININIQAQSWHSVGHGIGYGEGKFVKCSKVINDDLYVGGYFTSIKGAPGNYIAKFNGSNWDSLSCGFNDNPTSFDIFTNNKIYFGGFFSSICNEYNYGGIACWNGSSWEHLSTVAPNGTVHALKSYNNEIYIAGNFSAVGSLTTKKIARWDGNAWHDVGGGVWDPLPYFAQAMTIYNDELIVGGYFLKAATDTVYNIAAWNGSQWHALGKGTNDLVWSLYTDTIDNLLYAGGNFTYVDDTLPVHHIACWDGQKWIALKDSADDFIDNPYPLAITRFNNEIYAGGMNSNNNFLCKWDGMNWTKVEGPDVTVQSLSVYKGNLYVGGGFSSINGDTTIKYIACYGDSCPENVGINETQINKVEYLWQNIPNPFKNSTMIPYYVPFGTKGILQINDAKGILVKEYSLFQGKNELEISLSELKTGVYYYSIFINGVKKQTLKMVVQ